MTPIKIITWNIRGLNSMAKDFQNLKGDISLLQEMHLTNSNLDQLKSNWISQVFSTSSKKIEEATLINKNSPITTTQTHLIRKDDT